MLYAILKPVVGIALQWYYRSLTTANLERIPGTGPVFLAANHPNSLTDAMVLGWASPRRVRFTAKATIFGNPLAAKLLRSLGVVPLRRAADEPRGVDADAAATTSATTPDATTPDATSTPNAQNASRNAASFAAVADALAEHACIVVFPEGKTHDEPYMAPLRTGLARMALMARDERGIDGVRIVPIGLLFEEKAAPRSRILLQVGEPIAVDALRGHSATVAGLTELIDQRLRAVTLNFESQSDASRIQLLGSTLAALLEPTTSITDGPPPLARTLALVRRITRAQQALLARQSPELDARVAQFEERLRSLHDRLDATRIDLHDVGIDLSSTLGARFLLREVAIAAVLVPVSLWGRLTHVVPIRLARFLALRDVRALDEPPMRTFVLGVALVLGAYAIQTALVGAAFGPWWALLFLLTLVPSASSDLRYGDRVRRLMARARAYRRFRATPALQQSLVADAEWIRVEAGALEQLAARS